MYKTVVKIEGMVCGMCESHINDAIRKNFSDVKKVTSSHRKGEASFLTEDAVDADRMKAVIEDTGYHFKGIQSEPYVKKGLFRR